MDLKGALKKANLATDADLKKAEAASVHEKEEAEKQGHRDRLIARLPEQLRPAATLAVVKEPQLFSDTNLEVLVDVHEQAMGITAVFGPVAGQAYLDQHLFGRSDGYLFDMVAKLAVFSMFAEFQSEFPRGVSDEEANKLLREAGFEDKSSIK